MKVILKTIASLLIMQGCASKAPPIAAQNLPDENLAIHIPGIGGHMRIDDEVTRGLKEGGVTGNFEIYDWTGVDRGLPALGFVRRHHEQAAIIAEKLTNHVRQHPGTRVIVTCHSAGCGVVVFALEQMPADVKIDTLLMMQSALSPQYDLSKALKHVNRAYSFYSPYDPVLDYGTRTFGTVDRLFTAAAGRVSYSCPTGADVQQYQKLTQFGYQPSWQKLGNIGDHIGPMDRDFGRLFLAPLLLTGNPPVLSDK